MITLDPIKPYLTAIRIAGYVILAVFLFSGGCSYGKHKQTVKISELETALGVCNDANQANLAAIKALREANAAYASESAKQADKVGSIQKELKQAEKRAEALEKASKRKAKAIYQKNPDWAGEKVPDGIVELLND